MDASSDIEALREQLESARQAERQADTKARLASEELARRRAERQRLAVKLTSAERDAGLLDDRMRQAGRRSERRSSGALASLARQRSLRRTYRGSVHVTREDSSAQCSSSTAGAR
jgi:hypothetical protein